MKELPLYWVKKLDYQFLTQGDEITFDGQNWIVHEIRLIYLGGRHGDTVEHAKLTLLTVALNEIGIRKEIRLTLYAQWFIEEYPADEELRKIPEFQYQTVGKRTWGQMWMKLPE